METFNRGGVGQALLGIEGSARSQVLANQQEQGFGPNNKPTQQTTNAKEHVKVSCFEQSFRKHPSEARFLSATLFAKTKYFMHLFFARTYQTKFLWHLGSLGPGSLANTSHAHTLLCDTLQLNSTN
jgi:hypothetical protein